MNEHAAEKLNTERATELTRVLDLQSRWENLSVGAGNPNSSLSALQKTFEAYRVRLAEYVARFKDDHIPDLSPSGPQRLGAWCRTLRAVFRKADGESPAQVLVKARRMVDRIATRMTLEPVRQEPPPKDMEEVIRQLDAIIAWCDGSTEALPIKLSSTNSARNESAGRVA